MKKNHLNVVLLSTNHFNRENYVVARFSPPCGENNQMVVFFSLAMGGNSIVPLLKKNEFPLWEEVNHAAI